MININISYSVIMTVFNGERYIIDQLESIRFQSIEPREVLIFDDCSTDSSPEIINNYILNNSLTWKLTVNSNNLGWRQNFIKGLSLATQDFVFPCDQDDIWDKSKCETMIKFMNNNPDCNLLMSNYQVFSSDRSIKIPLFMLFQMNIELIRKHKPTRRRFLTIYRPGCTYCIRNSFLRQIIDKWCEPMAHDTFLYHQALLIDSVYLLHIKTIKFRRHENNNSPKSQRYIESRIDQINRSITQIRSYQTILSTDNEKFTNSYKKRIKMLQNVERFQNMRIKFFLIPSVKPFLYLIPYGFLYYPKISNLIGDFFIGFFKNFPKEDQ